MSKKNNQECFNVNKNGSRKLKKNHKKHKHKGFI